MNFEQILYTFVIISVIFVAIIITLVIIDMAVDKKTKVEKEVVIVKEPQVVTVVKEVIKNEPVVVTKTVVKKPVEVPTEEVPYISVDNGSGKPVSLNLNINGKEQQIITRNKKINVNFE